jgi:hypothetical protein
MGEIKKEIDCENCYNFDKKYRQKKLLGKDSGILLKKKYYCLKRQKMYYAGGKWHPPKIYECDYYSPIK